MFWRKRYFDVSENHCATDQEIPGLKSVARCSDAILRAHAYMRMRCIRIACAPRAYTLLLSSTRTAVPIFANHT